MFAELQQGETGARAPFVGRQEEASRLCDALAPVLSGEGCRAVLILAPTGGGKTAFVEHLAPTLESRRAVVVAGKFDQVVRDIPYAALIDALRAWLRRASVLPPREFEQVRQDLRQRLGASAPVLGGLLPELSMFLGDLPGAPTLGIREDRNRFQFAVLALLHAMTDGGRACLLFLDDLQWADAATLALIVRICLDSGLPRVGFVLTHRTDDEEALARTSLSLRPLAGAAPLLTRLALPALSAGDIGAMIQFSRRTAAGPGAAQALLARTGGNPLFVTEVLRWESAPGPASPTGQDIPAAEDVSGLLLRRLKDLAPDEQALLGTGAMMGSHIESALLAAVLDRDERSVRSLLEQAVRDAVLVREDGNGTVAYRFRHDELRQAALDLVPAARQPSLHARLGQILGDRVVGGDAAVAFEAAFHLHLAGTDGVRDDQRLLAATVDLACARRARRAAAERSAYEHASRACRILGEWGWSAAYELTLEAHTEAACAAFAVGAAEDFRRLAHVVKERARSFMDELPMQEVLVVALTGSGDVPAAFDLVCEGARRFGLSLPSEPGADDIAAAARRIDLALATMTPEWLAKTDHVDDPSIIALLRLLGLGNAAAYTARPHLLRMLVALELDLSARHGFSDVTALALAYLGALDCASPQTVRRGIGIRARALAAAKRVSDGAILARTLDIVHGMTSAWTGPLRDAVTPLWGNAQLGLEHGAFDYAGYSALKSCFFALLSGTPLDEVASRLDAWRHTLGELGQRLAHAYLSRDRQVVELLRRRATGQTHVSGEFSDEASCWRDYDAQDDHYGALYLAVGKLLLAAVFVDPAAASEASVRLARHAKGGYGLPHLEFGRFYAAVCAWDAAYAGVMERADAMERIDETLAEITDCAELVPPTFAHKRWLLRALAADLRGDTSEALKAFDSALEGARSSGYLHEAGLAADRASRVCARIGRWEQAEAYRARADEAWTDWGASARTRRCAGVVPTQREAEAIASTTDEPRALERLMENVPRWFGARRAWLVRVGDDLEIVATADGDRLRCHPASPDPLGSVPCLDPALVVRVAASAAMHEPVPGPAPAGGIWVLPLVFQTRAHGVLALDLPPGIPSAEALVAATFACAHVAAVIDAARFQASLSRQARERDRAEEALRKNGALLRNILDATRAVIYVKGVDGRYMLVNRVYTELFGVTDANASDKTDFDIFPREIAQTLRSNDLEVLRSRQPLERLEEVLVRGEPRIYMSFKVPLLSEDGIPFAVCGVSADITELRRAEEALRESDRRKSEFLAMLSHELRNPLAPIRNSLYILGRAEPGGEQALRARAVIERQVEHLTRLIDDLLDVTRISRGKVQLKRERLDLNELAQRTAEDHRAAFIGGDVHLELLPARAEVWVNGDRTRLAQVIGNLLQNAAKFTPRGGKVSLSVGGDFARGRATVLVQDTGRGIAPEILPRVFEAFIQADNTLDRSKGGLGLGLALVKGMVEMHGGSVSAASGGPGMGATFTITLPLETAIPTEPSPRRASSGAPARRVLVIEDNVDAADTLRDALELGAHVVTVAYCGPEGLAKARPFRPDVVICDIGLPEMDGYAVARAMRADAELGRVTLIALTGYAQPEDVAKARAAGFDAHLAKPPSIEALERVLAGVRCATSAT
ncbi:ATP-binding protein [Anaeromyxobacter terrae]|uniref:ATP-binding protein n=1 Tax=Anaeromyxobacter terrae TaxID=2925406 RepID=UPI001F59DF33|nr:ATP-binding protein [Anaeromyxobacter sp. SG22]